MKSVVLLSQRFTGQVSAKAVVAGGVKAAAPPALYERQTQRAPTLSELWGKGAEEGALRGMVWSWMRCEQPDQVAGAVRDGMSLSLPLLPTWKLTRSMKRTLVSLEARNLKIVKSWGV